MGQGPKGALKVAVTVMNAAKLPFDAANAALTAANELNKVGAKAAQMITSGLTGGIIDIKEITFDVRLGLMTKGHFAASMKARFMSGPVKTFSFNIKLDNVASMVTDLVNNIKNDIKKIL